MIDGIILANKNTTLEVFTLQQFSTYKSYTFFYNTVLRSVY